MKKRSDLLMAAVAAVGLAGGVAWSGGAFHDASTETVHARFASAAPLVDGNQVKVGGVVVGTVKSMKVVDGVADVTMDIDKEALPLHQDAHLTIRPVSLLGERYVDLQRGTPDAPVLAAGSVIPLNQTATSVGLDEVLNTVDAPSGAGLRGLVTTLGEGMQGNGVKVDVAINRLAPSMTSAQAMARVLSQQNRLLGRLVDNFQPVASALATRDGRAMDRLVGSSDQILAAVSRRQVELDQTLGRLPRTLTLLRSTLSNLDVTAKSTAPTLRALRPLTDRLPAFSGELKTFADALDPALATSQPVLDKAYGLLKAARPDTASLRKAGPGLVSAVHGTRRIVDQLTRNRDNLFAYIRYWALTTNGYDGLSHYFRVNATINPQTLTGLLPKAPTGTTPAAGGNSSGGNVPGLGGSLGGTLGGTLGGVGNLLTGTLGTLLGGGSSKASSPTGLTNQQQLNLLGSLLGGN